MKILRNQIDAWADKVNFVDANNVLVGYDISQQCCEHAGWYIADHRRTDTNDKKTIVDGLDGYAFDSNFFERVPGAAVEDGGMVRFRLVEEGKPDLFLHIFNSHNGYYGHGFTAEHSGTVVQSAYL
jgi:hypothetical protein